MGGYIAVTNDRWCCSQKDRHNTVCIFWRKNPYFKALSKGERFYFYSKEGSAARRIVGYAHFERFEVNTIQEAWDKYKSALGSDSFEEFYDAVTTIYSGGDNIKLGCIVLSNPVWGDYGIVLSAAGISYTNGTVAGKTIDEDEDRILSNMIIRGNHE